MAGPPPPRRRRIVALALAVAVCAAIAVLRALPTPSHERPWIVPQSVLPRVVVDGDRLEVRHLRNFRYGADGAVARAVWEDRSYDLGKLDSAWLGVAPFGGVPGVAHVFVSFGFSDGQFLAVSVEARREQGEEYGVLRGVMRAYEMIYVLADERDVIALRSNVWRDDVYLYPVRAARADVRAALLDIAARVNAIAAQPEFYDTIGNSCSSNLARHVNRVVPGKVPVSYKVLFAAFSDELAHELGLLDADGPLDQVRRRFHINARAAGDIDAGDFSARIRAAR